jgi:hypothetical protein
MCRRWLWLPLLAACADADETGRTQDLLDAAGSGATLYNATDDCPPDVGIGELVHALTGPGPLEAAQIGGSAFTLIKNWDFGKLDSIRDAAAMSAEFDYHDQFDTIANGANYGAVTVAASAETAINAWNLSLPDDRQPIEDPARPYRELTEHTLRTYVRPLSPEQDSAVVAEHSAGSGSFMAKWNMPKAGAALDRDMLWETRARIPKPVQGYWFALWTAGTSWSRGPEIDVVESFGSPYVRYNAFHSVAVGGTNGNDFTSWPLGLDHAGVPYANRDLSEWHTWSLLYRKDDGFAVYFDGYLVQQGQIHWRLSGDAQGQLTGLHFLFDLGWGHTGIPELNIALWAEQFPVIYEIDYSRVYLR